MILNMSPEKIIFITSVLLALSSTVLLVYKKMPKKLKHDKFYDQWRNIQKRCSDRTQWKDAIVEADKLLDEALKKKKMKGNSMGERLVSAEKLIGKHEEVWFGHKLRKKLEENPDSNISKNDTKNALLGIGQALKDLGALK